MGVLRQSCGNSFDGLTSVTVSGCLTGLGTFASPLGITIDPTGLLGCGGAGLKLLNAPVASVITSGCLTGSGISGSPITISLNPTGGIHCTISGLALQNTYLTQVITSGCFDGIGTVGSPLLIKVDPTGLLSCGPNGIKLLNAPVASVVSSGCLSGSGVSASPLVITFNPTGLIHCTPNGIAFNGTTGILNGVRTLGCISGDGLTTPLQVIIDPTGLLACGPSGLRYIGPTGGGAGVPAPPLTSVQFNNNGSFGGSASLVWNSGTSVLGVTGTITTRNVTSIVHTIADGTGVDLNPSSGAIQVWTLGGNRTPTANSFTEGQSITLMVDDGSDFSIDWSTINPTWVDGTEPTLFDTGYSVIELWKVGSTIYGASLTSGVTGTTTPGSPFTSIQFNNAGAFGGSSRLTWDGTIVGLSGAINVSGATLTSDLAHVLAQRNSTNPQGFRLYNTFTNSSNYERASIDWTGSPGVLQIGTSHAGTGTAKGVQVITSGTPRIDIASNGQIQFNSVYTFPTVVGASGQTFVNNGVGSLSWGTPHIYATGCIFGSGTPASPVQLILDPTGLLLCGANGLKYNGPTGTLGGLPAPPNTSIQFNDGGVFGGSSRLTWDGATVGLSGTINVSGASLTSDGVHILAQRNGSNAQAVRIYNTYTNASNYERASIDWAGSPGVLQIGTSHAGTGTAKGVQIITSGTPRIDIASNGQIQFHQTYTFPTGLGGSGQTFVNNGVGVLSWGTPNIYATGCLTGSGTIVSPLQVKVDPTGLLSCGPAGLRYIGPTGGAGTPAPPHMSLQFNNGGSFGGSSGLIWNGTGVILSTLADTGTLFSAGRPADATSLFQLQQYDSFISARYATVRGEGIYLAQDSTDNRVGLMGQFGIRVASNLNYSFSDSTSGVLSIDTSLYRDSAGSLGQRRTTAAQKFSVYKTFTNLSEYERGTLDWQGSPGTFRIGTEQAGTGAANPVHLITSGTPRIEIAANGQVQFHQAYTFPTGLGSSGQTFVNNGAGFLNWGTPYVISSGCVTGSGTLASPLQVKLDPTGLLACGTAGLRYIGPTGGVAGLPAPPNTSIQFNDGGLFGGSSRLTWDGTTVGLSGAINVSGATLTSDSTHILAQRNGSNAQGSRIYNTYTNASNYERAIIDWAGSPGVLQIGTQHAGTGTAKGVQIVTSGTPRIDIASNGSIQFNSAYIFPTTDGVSGQFLGTNGVGSLSWRTPSGGTGSPAAPDTSIQFNNAGAFGGSANLTWDGTNLKLIGGGIQIDGTSNLYPMLTNSADTTNEMQIRLADNSDLANLRVNFIHVGGVSGIRMNAAGSGIAAITNNLGSDFQRLCLGGTTNLYPALKKVGTGIEARLADDSAYTTLRCASLNLSTDVILERDAADTLALRRSTNAQKLSVYNTYTSSVNYERGVMDFKGSPGVLRIGTEQQGLGVANPIDIITSGTPRISIAALGNIQFNQAYTFPTGVGSSGQTFVHNGSATLVWGLPSVRATGCLTGSGTVATPLQLQLNPTGFLHCTPLGLAYNGPTGASVGGATPGLPFNSIQFNNAGNFGGSSGLTWDGTTVGVTGNINISGSILTSDALNYLSQRRGTSANSFAVYNTYTSPTNYERGAFCWQTVPNTLQIGTERAGAGLAQPLNIITSGTPRIGIAASGAITFNQAYTFPTDVGGASGSTFVNNGLGQLTWGTPRIQTSTCVVGSGTAVSPLRLSIDPTGLLGCGANGLKLLNAPAAGGTSLTLTLTGAATHADPVTAVDLVYNNGVTTNTIDFRPLIYFNMGQAGDLVADGSIDNQPRFIVPEGFQLEICRAYLTIGNPGSDTTTVQLQRYVATTDCTEPGTNGTPFSKDILDGCTWQRWDEIEGLTLGSLTQITFRILTPGNGAQNLVAHIWARATVCFEP